MGFLLIAIPIFALVFGSDEPAMQTDNAAMVFTGMIFFGIIMMASSSKNKAKSTTPIQLQRREIRTSTVAPTAYHQSSSSQMTHGNTTGTQVITRVLVVCPYCGSKNEQGILKCQHCSAEL